MYSTLYINCKGCYTFFINVKGTIHKRGDRLQNRIQKLRKERKLTQSELANDLEVTRQTIISLESGRYNASLILAHKIARLFDLTIEDIFIFDDEEEE